MISPSYVDGLELRIKELTKSNNALTAALEKVSDYNLRLEESQKSFISALAKSDEYITKLENERDALVAKLSMVIAAWNGYDYDAINAEINKTPQQCIAEIKAEAIESLLPKCIYSEDHKVEIITKDMVRYNAEKIRKGGL